MHEKSILKDNKGVQQAFGILYFSDVNQTIGLINIFIGIPELLVK
jgi:hypothetical protein